MNTITKDSILAGDKLAALYAAELRGRGFSPQKCDAVTPERLLPVAFQNGALYKVALPFGRLAKWARTFEGNPEFCIGFENGRAALRTIDGRSEIIFADRLAKVEGISGAVPPVKFDDNNHASEQFHLITPPDMAVLQSGVKSAKDAAKVAKLRRREIEAKQALKLATREHCAELAKMAGGLPAALDLARRIRAAKNLFRGSLEKYLSGMVFPWLLSASPEDSSALYYAASEYRLAKHTVETYAAPLRYDGYTYRTAKRRGVKPSVVAAEWGEVPKPVYGPTFEAYKEKAKSKLWFVESKFSRQFSQWCEAQGLPAVNYSWIKGNDYTRARLAVRQWPARKAALAAQYVEALNARRNAVKGGAL
jgi:hypothetical protein